MHVSRGQQRTSYWTLYQHLTVTMQRNVGGGTAGGRGRGVPWGPWPVQVFKEICGARKDKGCPLPPCHAFQRASHILCSSAHDGRVLMVIAAWGEGVNV